MTNEDDAYDVNDDKGLSTHFHVWEKGPSKLSPERKSKNDNGQSHIFSHILTLSFYRKRWN